MSGADSVARALNSWASEGLDTLGVADGEALDRLLTFVRMTTKLQEVSTMNRK